MFFAGQHMREMAISVAVGGNIDFGGGQHAKGNEFNGTSLWFSSSMSMGKKVSRKAHKNVQHRIPYNIKKCKFLNSHQ